MPDADHRLYVVWTNTFPRDGEESARGATATFDDPRVHQFHDPGRAVGQAFAPRIHMPSLRAVAAATGAEVEALRGRFRDSYLFGPAAVFDTMFFFPPGVTWEDAPPPDSGWVTQLDPTTFQLDASRFYWGEAMGDEMARLVRETRDAASASRTAGARIGDAAAGGGDLARLDELLVAAHLEPGRAAGQGAVRILASTDGAGWTPVALLAEDGVDLREPRLSVTPDGELLLTCGGTAGRRPRAARSADGVTWGPLQAVEGIPDGGRLSRVAWQAGAGWCVLDPSSGASGNPAAVDSKKEDGAPRVALYRTLDGLRYERAGGDLPVPAVAGEGALAFEPDGAMLVVLGDAGDAEHAWLLRAEPPYETFAGTDVAHGVDAPNILRLGDGTLLLATSPPGEGEGTAEVLRLARDGSFERALELEADGGADGLALVAHGDVLWVRYGSSGGAYVARVPVDAVR